MSKYDQNNREQLLSPEQLKSKEAHELQNARERYTEIKATEVGNFWNGHRLEAKTVLNDTVNVKRINREEVRTAITHAVNAFEEDASKVALEEIETYGTAEAAELAMQDTQTALEDVDRLISAICDNANVLEIDQTRLPADTEIPQGHLRLLVAQSEAGSINEALQSLKFQTEVVNDAQGRPFALKAERGSSTLVFVLADSDEHMNGVQQEANKAEDEHAQAAHQNVVHELQKEGYSEKAIETATKEVQQSETETV